MDRAIKKRISKAVNWKLYVAEKVKNF
jgi:hypothetical protein